MKYNIWLDDVRKPSIKGIWCTSFNDFVITIKNNGIPELVSFDYDLGTKETGYDCLKFLAIECLEQGVNLPEIRVHSANPVGAKNIKDFVGSFDRMKEIYNK